MVIITPMQVLDKIRKGRSAPTGVTRRSFITSIVGLLGLTKVPIELPKEVEEVKPTQVQKGCATGLVIIGDFADWEFEPTETIRARMQLKERFDLPETQAKLTEWQKARAARIAKDISTT